MVIRTKVFNGSNAVLTFDKDVDSLNELKVAFLKRFGNVVKGSRKAEKEKPLIKQLTYEAQSTSEWSQAIRLNTRYTIEFIKIGG